MTSIPYNQLSELDVRGDSESSNTSTSTGTYLEIWKNSELELGGTWTFTTPLVVIQRLAISVLLTMNYRWLKEHKRSKEYVYFYWVTSGFPVVVNDPVDGTVNEARSRKVLSSGMGGDLRR